jgi:MoaA/NifB/PqqE/SkfB family radical SAM enzyme
MSDWNILYRGSLSSCNYECSYCPFAKTKDTREELRRDESELARFVGWIAQQKKRIRILFTPWGEALVHSYYRRALTQLSHLPNVTRVSIQTNLSAPVTELLDANRETLALWTTFHPSQVSIRNFVRRCRQLDGAEIRYSVGVVGLRENFDAIERLRRCLPREVYLWINAFKRDAGYYAPDDVARLLAVDPYFLWNLQRYASAGRACWAGERSFTVDGAGDVRRCHFIGTVIGNIYADDFESCLKPRACSIASCRCHIGYVHRPELRLEELYGDGLLERIPRRWPEVIEEFGSAQPAGDLRSASEMPSRFWSAASHLGT